MNRDSHIVQIELEKIVPNRFQPRKTFNEDITELAESIRQHGVLQPITVRPLGEKFEIVMGERRYRACEKLGIRKIPCIVVQMDDRETMEVALIENLQRQDLTPIEEALSYKRILESGNVTQEQLAQRIGKNQSTIANKLRLLTLDKEVQKALLKGEISERHARTLLQLNDQELQRQLLKKIVDGKLTVRKTEEEVRKAERGMHNFVTEPESVEIMDVEENYDDSRAQVSSPNNDEVITSGQMIQDNFIQNDNISRYGDIDSWQFSQKGIDDDYDFGNTNKPKPKQNIPTLDIVDDMSDKSNLNTIGSNHSFNTNYADEKVLLTNIEPDKIVQNDDLLDDADSDVSNGHKITYNNFEEIRPLLEKFQSDIKALGYKVDLEKNDFESMYQLIFKIYKKNL